jgi:hypothetical protein
LLDSLDSFDSSVSIAGPAGTVKRRRAFPRG